MKHGNDPARRSKLAGCSVNLLLLAGSLTVALAGGEIVIRLFTSAPAPRESSLREFTEYDPELGWKGAPGASGVYSTADFSVPVALNSGGWRDDELSAGHRQPSGASGQVRSGRILLLGDSYAWGFGVRRGEMFADRLEERLEGREVLNLGVPGYGPDQELILLRRVLRNHAPGLVVIQISLLNDLASILTPDAYRLPKPRFVPSGEELTLTNVPVERLEHWERISTSWMVKDILTRRLRLFAWTRERWRNFKAVLAGAVGRVDEMYLQRARVLQRDPHRRVERGWALLELLLRDIRAECDSACAQVAVLVVSDSLQADDALWTKASDAFGLDPSEYDRDLPNRRLAGIASRLGIAVVDPLPLFRERLAGGEELFISEEDPHWNARGHELAAGLLARAIEEGLIPLPAGCGEGTSS